MVCEHIWYIETMWNKVISIWDFEHNQGIRYRCAHKYSAYVRVSILKVFVLLFEAHAFLDFGTVLQMLGRRNMLLDWNVLAGSGVDAWLIFAPENVQSALQNRIYTCVPYALTGSNDALWERSCNLMIGMNGSVWPTVCFILPAGCSVEVSFLLTN